MPAYTLDIDVLGDEELGAKLRAMGDRAILAEPAFHEIVDVFRESEEALWSRGRSWTPNAPETVAKKGKNDPLVLTGALKASLTEKDDRNQLVVVENDTLRFGSKLWYAHFAIGTRNQPKRTLVRLRPQDRLRVSTIIREWVLHGDTRGAIV